MADSKAHIVGPTETGGADVPPEVREWAAAQPGRAAPRFFEHPWPGQAAGPVVFTFGRAAASGDAPPTDAAAAPPPIPFTPRALWASPLGPPGRPSFFVAGDDDDGDIHWAQNPEPRDQSVSPAPPPPYAAPPQSAPPPIDSRPRGISADSKDKERWRPRWPWKRGT